MGLSPSVIHEEPSVLHNVIWATLLAAVAAAQTPSALDYTQWRGGDMQ